MIKNEEYMEYLRIIDGRQRRRAKNKKSLSRVVYPTEETWYRLLAKREGSPCWFIACETRNKHKLKRKYNKLIECGFIVTVEFI